MILPVERRGDRSTTRLKLCEACGYLHPVDDEHGPGPAASAAARRSAAGRCTTCSACRTSPPGGWSGSTQRRGGAPAPGLRAASPASASPSTRATLQERTAEVAHDGEPLARLTYGHNATLWRINKGWRRRANPAELGFVLDVERGYWAKNELETETDPDDPMSALKERVIPFVEDTRNCLLVEPPRALTTRRHGVAAGGAQERHAGVLPARGRRAGGGAASRRKPTAARSCSTRRPRAARACCASSSTTRTRWRRSPARPSTSATSTPRRARTCGAPACAREDCEAACYDCLMTYSNQRDHALLDRHAVLWLLEALRDGEVELSPTPRSRAEHLAGLKRLCDSQLEERWLDYIDGHGLRLPERAQVLIESCGTRARLHLRRRVRRGLRRRPAARLPRAAEPRPRAGGGAGGRRLHRRALRPARALGRRGRPRTASVFGEAHVMILKHLAVVQRRGGAALCERPDGSTSRHRVLPQVPGGRSHRRTRPGLDLAQGRRREVPRRVVGARLRRSFSVILRKRGPAWYAALRRASRRRLQVGGAHRDRAARGRRRRRCRLDDEFDAFMAEQGVGGSGRRPAAARRASRDGEPMLFDPFDDRVARGARRART